MCFICDREHWSYKSCVSATFIFMTFVVIITLSITTGQMRLPMILQYIREQKNGIFCCAFITRHVKKRREKEGKRKEERNSSKLETFVIYQTLIT